MPLDAWNTILAGFTFAVVSTAAVAAIIQLRHLRASNQLSALLTVLETWQDRELQELMKYVRTDLQEKLKDPAFLDGVRDTARPRPDDRDRRVCDWFEQVGSYVKNGLLDERLFLDLVSSTSVRYWNWLWPVISTLRERSGPATYENFEYLAVRSRLWTKRYPNGVYPRNTPRFADLDAADTGTSAAASKP